MIKVKVASAAGNGTQTVVTKRGQLVVSSIDFSTFYATELNVINTGFEIVAPNTNKNFIITTIFMYANKGVGAADASVQLYESSESAILTIDKQVFNTEMPKYSKIVLTGLQIEISQGKWLNAVTDDNTIFVNVAGYYVDA